MDRYRLSFGRWPPLRLVEEGLFQAEAQPAAASGGLSPVSVQNWSREEKNGKLKMKNGFACNRNRIAILDKCSRKCNCESRAGLMTESVISFLLVRPLPPADLRAVNPVLVSVAAACDLAVAEFLFGIRTDALEHRDSVNRVDCETKPIRLIVNCQFHPCVDVAFFFVATNMRVPVVCAAVGKTVNQPPDSQAKRDAVSKLTRLRPR